jgi:hypothetical protein
MSRDGVRSTLKVVAIILTAIYLVGAIYWGADVLLAWFRGGTLPSGKWWHLVIAPVAIGLVVVVLQAIGHFLDNGFSFAATQSQFRQRAGEATIVLLMIAIAIGWPLYQIAHQ